MPMNSTSATILTNMGDVINIKDNSNNNNNKEQDKKEESKDDQKMAAPAKGYVVWNMLAGLMTITTAVLVAGTALVMNHLKHLDEDCEEHIAEIHYSWMWQCCAKYVIM